MPYFLGTEVTVSWVLQPTASPLAESAYDIRLFPPDLTASYTDAGIINYVAPTASYPGNMDYAVTPSVPGRWRIQLVTGTADATTIIDEKDFWVFELANRFATANVLNVYGNQLDPSSTNILLNLVSDPTNLWGQIDCIAADDQNGLFLISGYKGATHTLQFLDPTDGSQVEVTTGLPYLNFAGMARTPNGRLWVSSAYPDVGKYGLSWSVSPYTSWTEVEKQNQFTGRLLWDDFIEPNRLWLASTYLYSGTETWSQAMPTPRQQYDLLGDIANNYAFQRLKFANGSNILFSGGGEHIGGGESVYAIQNTTGPIPLEAATITRWLEVYGTGTPSHGIRHFMLNPDKSRVIAIGGWVDDIWIASSLTGIDTWTGVTEVKTLPGMENAYIHTCGFTMHDYGKSFLCTIVNDPTPYALWIESTDGITWVKSEDPMVTSYNAPYKTTNEIMRFFARISSNDRICFMHEKTENTEYYPVWTD